MILVAIEFPNMRVCTGHIKELHNTGAPAFPGIVTCDPRTCVCVFVNFNSFYYPHFWIIYYRHRMHERVGVICGTRGTTSVVGFPTHHTMHRSHLGSSIAPALLVEAPAVCRVRVALYVMNYCNICIV